jgi:nicotinate-nucleotide adenylyltransferase
MNTIKKTVGILGVSGDPLHAGHKEAGVRALEIPELDEVLFMVTPHNPLKSTDGIPVEHRTHLAHLELKETGRLGSELKVSDFEVLLQRFDVENSTAVMLEHFSQAYPNIQPVWMMGADNLAGLHTWGPRWREIMQYPVVVFAREGDNERALSSVAAQEFASTFRSADLFACVPGTWTFISHIDHSASSTKIRAQLSRGEVPQDVSKASLDYIFKHNLYGYQDACTQKFSPVARA